MHWSLLFLKLLVLVVIFEVVRGSEKLYDVLHSRTPTEVEWSFFTYLVSIECFMCSKHVYDEIMVLAGNKFFR